jgi:hypothetical protein
MTVLKLDGKPSSAAMQAIEPHIRRLYARSGVRVMAVVELAHVERTEPAADADKDASVKMRISHLEIPGPDQEDSIREVLRSLYLQRTSTGTLDELGELELSKQTIADAGGIIGHIAVARMSAGIHHWAAYLRRVTANQALTVGELRHELDAVADGLAGLLGTHDDPEET